MTLTSNRYTSLQFICTEPQTELEHIIGGFHYIHAFGRIEPADDGRFKNFLDVANPPPRTMIYIDSTGGDVEAAIGIGRLIREGWHSTSVGSFHINNDKPKDIVIERDRLPGKCLSAATLVYLGGKLRYYSDGSQFGVHQFSFKDPSPENLVRSQALSATIAKFILDMEVSIGFMEISSAVPSGEISIIDADQLRAMGFVTDGVTDAKWSVQARGNMIYVRGERDSLYGHHKVMLVYMKAVGFLFWAVIEAQAREDELMSFGLVEIVINGEETRIDITDRCNRNISGSYVNILAEITEEEARVLAFSESFGVQVRFSNEVGVFLGIAAVDTNGGREQLETLFNCFSSGPTPT
jgi:hypothetical protein